MSGESMMHQKFQQFSLIFIGAVAGVMLSLNFPAAADKENPRALPIEELRAFTEVFGRIKSDYVEVVEDKKLIDEAIKGMLTGLDPHSAYLDVDAYKELQIGTQGEFGGLGIEVTMEDGLIRIISPIEDSPAHRAGIKPGDLIIKLNSTAVKGMTLSDAIKIMRGKPNTSITISIFRKGESKPINFTLMRAIIKIQSVRSIILEPGYAYLRITQFQEQTGENLAKALEKLFKESSVPMKGLVLDFRNNPGGLLNAAVGVSAIFLPANSLVVYTDGRTNDAKMRLKASPEFYLRDNTKDDPIQKLPSAIKTVPIITLVNAGSASASEIVAGALQDHKRSLVMGTQTFGKGSVQTILPLGNNTGIKLTTARYYTPNGRSIQAKGITPDIIDISAKDESDRLREADLDHHLSNGKIEGSKSDGIVKIMPKPETKTPELKNENEGEKKNELPIEFGSSQDLLLVQAMNYLKELAPTPIKESKKN
jgi:carboxyl-terminal processing protease